MRIKTLENINIDELLDAFNRSFENYFVPIKLSKEQLIHKIKTENIDFNLSIGAYKQGKLIGFILHASGVLNGIKTFYNAGTGVVPEERGQQLILKFYDNILPILKEEHFKQGTLEVITANTPAIRIYEKVGFEIVRTLPCLKSEQLQLSKTLVFNVLEEEIDWSYCRTFWDWQPTWQNQPVCINRQPNLKKLSITQKGGLIAYAVYNPDNARVISFAVHKSHRRQGLGSSLFSYVAKKLQRPLSVINSDGTDMATDRFLEKIGFKQFLTQYEMKTHL